MARRRSATHIRHSRDGMRVATLGAVALFAACADATLAPERTATAGVGAWTTWVLPSGATYRPPAPPDPSTPTAWAERDEIIQLQAARTAATDSVVRRWNGDPTSIWTRYAVERLDFYWPLLPDVRLATPARSARIMALLHVALHDAMIAVWDAKYAYRRLAPARADSRVKALVPLDGTPSYPSEHAAAAAVAYTVLWPMFLTSDTVALSRETVEAAQSRKMAGAASRSDIDAGWALGRAVAAQVLQRAATDGSSLVWTGTVPAGVGSWQPTPPRRVSVPFDPLAGTWKTWVLPSGDAFRLPPPPSLGSAVFTRALSELRQLDASRTPAQADLARYWATDAPSARWELYVDEELATRRWSVPHAARARAFVSVAMYDAFVACWDSKFAYWLARPVTVDPAIKTVYSTPPFPSYPSGHSTVSTAAAEVMAELFAEKAGTWRHRAEEASQSRVWGGVHYRFDIVDGDSLGARVGRAVVARMRREK